MRNRSFALIIVAIMVLGLASEGRDNFVKAQSGTNEAGIINSDTTWTKIGSPYSLTGPLAVNQGATLTIEAGTTVNLNNYYIQVNGTLIAKGSGTEKISINGINNFQQITITSVSNGWNQQTGSGCIIENTIISKASIIAENSAKIDSNTIDGGVSAKSASIVTNNNITGGTVAIGDSTTLSNNLVTGSVSLLFGGTVLVSVASGSSATNMPIVSNNIIYGSAAINGNVNEGIECSGYVTITDNTISRCETGIKVNPYENSSGFPHIEKNVITNNQDGIDIVGGSNTPLIQDNLLTNNTNAISIGGPTKNPAGSPTILNNNIYGNNNNMVLGVSYNINATNNWWGTTDQQAINQSIYDFKNDFNLGTVNFVPFLTAPNPQAPILKTSNPTPAPTSSLPTSTPTPSPTIPEFQSTIIVLIMLPIGVTSFLYVQKQRRKKA